MKKQEAKYAIISGYYAEHVEDVRMFVESRIKNVVESEDIVQNIFLRLLSSDSILTESTLSSLVYTIARNMIYDYYRHRRSVEEYISFAGADKHGFTTPESSVYSAREVHEMLERGIETLKESQRKIYRMNIYDGLPVSEISKTLNIKYKTVESKLGVARKEIRRFMERMFA